MARLFAYALVPLLILASSAEAQFFSRRSSEPAEPAGPVQPWPYPAPDAQDWWDGEWPVAAEVLDPLGGRRAGRRERMTAVDNGVDANLYRLWGLPPLQWQVLRGDEMILEVWVRPSGSVRQMVTRVVVRQDDKAFVQARAGLACCEPGIARRVDINAELPEGAAAQLRALRNHDMWSAPREVRVTEAEDTADAICVEGTAYDVTLMVPGRSVSLRRACDRAEIGQVADALEAAVKAALGHDTRFDVLFPRGADFSRARTAYNQLIESGGRLQAARTNRAQAPSFTPEPNRTEEGAAAAPNAATGAAGTER
ncbi:hypothetical protein ACFODL_03080 [Phenylobacterium terrae]|uniref:Secreted protein n=1 Tax=Phenylobacterium terrae TaxID=2665495 RepID=A0ABW4MWG0_9CAUL